MRKTRIKLVNIEGLARQIEQKNGQIRKIIKEGEYVMVYWEAL